MDRRVILEYRGDALELPRGVVNVGRDLSCALRIHDPSVSRRHMRFIHREDEVFVEDLKSTNGTMLNGSPIFQPIRLADSDVISIGDRTITVRINTPDFFDDLEPQTLVSNKKSRSDEDEEEESSSEAELPDEKKHVLGDSPTTQVAALNAPTQRMEAVVPDTLDPAGDEIPEKEAVKTTAKIPQPEVEAAKPVDRRCPKCAGVIGVDDEECQWCGHSWGDFSPRSTTHVGPVAVRERKHERHDVVLPLIYRSSTLEVEAETRDLSLGGLFVCSTILDAPGTDVELTILIDGGPSVALAGSVTRVVRDRTAPSGPGMGVQFKDIDDVAFKWLETTIARAQKAAVS